MPDKIWGSAQRRAVRKKHMDAAIFERLESNVRSYSRHFPTVFTRAKMSKMYSADGREYLDFFNGAGALNYGHNNDFIRDRIVEYLMNDGITHGLDLFTEAKGEFFAAFEKSILKPCGYEYKLLSCAPTGTNAVEAALKMARKAKGRRGVFAFAGDFHGMTLGSMAVTSSRSIRAGAHTGLPDVTFVPHPARFDGDALSYIEYLMTDEYSGVDKPAAVILETVQSEGGIVPMDGEFLKELAGLCRRQDVALIVDDIQVGCGRTGPFLSFEPFGIKPDLVCLSKSISGYGLPMSLVLINPELDVFTPGEHNGTFRGNQLAFIGAKAALEYREKVNLGAKTAEDGRFVADFIKTRILPMDERIVHRGRGMINGIDLEKLGRPELPGRVADLCFEKGLVMERAGRDDCVLKVMPALTIERSELTAGLEIVESALKECL